MAHMENDRNILIVSGQSSCLEEGLIMLLANSFVTIRAMRFRSSM